MKSVKMTEILIKRRMRMKKTTMVVRNQMMRTESFLVNLILRATKLNQFIQKILSGRRIRPGKPRSPNGHNPNQPTKTNLSKPKNRSTKLRQN